MSDQPRIQPEDIESMVEAMIAQSVTYPVVPHGYAGEIKPLNRFTATVCLVAALKSAGLYDEPTL